MRIGVGYDVHRFDKEQSGGQSLVLGGVEIPCPSRLEGWSDADVLTHAIIDALLGAAALGDIGGHFPSGEAQYEGISSLILLGRVRDELAENGWQIINIDATVLAKWPRLGGSIDRMRQKLSQTLGIALGQVSVKAKTSAEIGYAGRGDGVGCFAVALIEGIPE